MCVCEHLPHRERHDVDKGLFVQNGMIIVGALYKNALWVECMHQILSYVLKLNALNSLIS